MIAISIITRKLRKGKTHEDFRKAWYHTVGFGTTSKLYTAINALDQREIIVVGFVEVKPGQDPMKILRIDVKERLDNPLEAVIEPKIGRNMESWFPKMTFLQLAKSSTNHLLSTERKLISRKFRKE
jgi:hypothetical protein